MPEPRLGSWPLAPRTPHQVPGLLPEARQSPPRGRPPPEPLCISLLCRRTFLSLHTGAARANLLHTEHQPHTKTQRTRCCRRALLEWSRPMTRAATAPERGREKPPGQKHAHSALQPLRTFKSFTPSGDPPGGDQASLSSGSRAPSMRCMSAEPCASASLLQNLLSPCPRPA